MSFKKNNLKNNSNIFSSFIGIVSICVVFVIGIIVIKNLDLLSFEMMDKNLTKEEVIQLEVKKEEKIKEVRESNKINILLV
jgi:hypothetical protein